MRPRSLSLAAALFLTAATAFAQTTQPSALKVGDTAPPLKVGKWLKGEPVSAIEPGKIYVLDFWATWCVQCRVAMPHLTGLARKYPDIIFIGQDVQEDDPNDVKPFVDDVGDQIDYRVVLDDTSKAPRGAMNTTWIDSSGDGLLPFAVIVGKDSKIAWKGHPLNAAPVLQKLVAGTFDPQAEAASQLKEAQIKEKRDVFLKAKDVDGVLACTKQLAELRPEDADYLAVYEFNFLARNGRPDAARMRAEGIARTSKDLMALNTVAWLLATETSPQPADLTIARVAIDRAIEIDGGKEADYFNTSARVYAVSKDWTKAAATQRQALAIAPSDMKARLQHSLDAYAKQELPEE